MIKLSVRVLYEKNKVKDIELEIGHDHKPNLQIYQQGNTVYAFTEEGLIGFNDVKELTISFKD